MTIELPRSGPAILVVDDEPRILSALQRSLRREGYQLFTSESVQEALVLLSSRSFDLVVSDHKMPGMSGIQFLEEVARLQPDVPRLLITGWTEEIPMEELRRVGACALITKPWDDARLKATLRRALGMEPVETPTEWSSAGSSSSSQESRLR
ncbi:response regulator [Myxococcota bacterium]|nr:response regulator [Myxococcota bacterium]